MSCFLGKNTTGAPPNQGKSLSPNMDYPAFSVRVKCPPDNGPAPTVTPITPGVVIKPNVF